MAFSNEKTNDAIVNMKAFTTNKNDAMGNR